MEDYPLGDSLSGTRWIGAGSTALGLEGRQQGSDAREPFYIMGSIWRCRDATTPRIDVAGVASVSVARV